MLCMRTEDIISFSVQSSAAERAGRQCAPFRKMNKCKGRKGDVIGARRNEEGNYLLAEQEGRQAPPCPWCDARTSYDKNYDVCLLSSSESRESLVKPM